MSELAAGRHQAAWDVLAQRYSRLILATIRHLVHEHDDVMDVYSTVCQALSENGCARLRRYSDQPGGARFSTWLVAVVRNLSIDWLRKRDGRRRQVVPDGLSDVQRQIFTAVFLEGRSHVEAYELIAANAASLTYREYLRELRETYRLQPAPTGPAARGVTVELKDDIASPTVDAAEVGDTARRMRDALAALSAAQRLALDLFVVEGMSADEVARAVGLANAKAVYNSVYRTLALLRERLERAGIGADHVS